MSVLFVNIQNLCREHFVCFVMEYVMIVDNLLSNVIVHIQTIKQISTYNSHSCCESDLSIKNTGIGLAPITL